MTGGMIYTINEESNQYKSRNASNNATVLPNTATNRGEKGSSILASLDITGSTRLHNRYEEMRDTQPVTAYTSTRDIPRPMQDLSNISKRIDSEEIKLLELSRSSTAETLES
jgi:hypothetical protein